MSSHDPVEVHPRYGRMAAAGSAVAVTVVALLGGVGILPTSADSGSSPVRTSGAIRPAAGTPTGSPDSSTSPSGSVPATPAPSSPGSSAAPSASSSTAPLVAPAAVPAHSGHGRRIVYSESTQRVWLVSASGEVLRTYPVSGSLYDNLDPGTFEVYSRSAQAWGIDDSGTMRWFVRFYHGDNAAIGFHDIPIDNGKQVQTVAELGTPRSHGCIRQKESDAKALWAFAPVGTTVVVV